MRDYVARRLVALGNKLSTGEKGLAARIPEIGEDELALIGAANGLSMTDPVAQWEFIRAIRHVEAEGIAGDIVECGVWRGGNLVIAGRMRAALGFDRTIWAYDTFAGMTAPTDHDFKPVKELDVREKFAELDRGDHNEWCMASLEEVQANFAARGGGGALKTVKGPVQETLLDPANLPERIAVLRLDTDFYDSTKIEMEVLYPRLASGGVLIVDDYGEWAGARRAVDEYFAGRHVWLHYVTHTVRLMVKS